MGRSYKNKEDFKEHTFKCKDCGHQWKEFTEEKELPECEKCESTNVKKKS